MSAIRLFVSATILVVFAAVSASAQLPNCPLRPKSGTPVQPPLELRSQNGLLQLSLTIRNGQDVFNYMHYCLNYSDPVLGDVEAPTLRLNPGDDLAIDLTNRITGPNATLEMPGMAHKTGNASSDPCDGGTMLADSTNLHFHGLNVPPVCHGDEVVKTLIPTGAAPFQYRIHIPENEPPGLYWYHPHPHGFTTLQVSGGASGAIIIEGMEKFRPEVAGVPERVMIIRQQFLKPGSWVPGPYELSLNHQVVDPGLFPLPLIPMRAGKKEFWRVLNSSTVEFLTLQIQYVKVPQQMQLIAIDGVPLPQTRMTDTLQIPPAGRAEFIVVGPPEGVFGSFVNLGTDTGPDGDPQVPQQLANIAAAEPGDDATPVGSPVPSDVAMRFAGLRNQKPTAHRRLYFSEVSPDPNTTLFFITVAGQKPRLFTPDEPPAVTTKVGAIEDWVIENRTHEDHAFHIHQVHFLVTEMDGVPVTDPHLQDTVTVPYWTGTGPYPRVKIRLDFRDPETAGMFVYHCHILDHEDGGMMAKILVKTK